MLNCPDCKDLSAVVNQLLRSDMQLADMMN